MTADELRNLIFEKLHAELTARDGEPLAFVGIQGDAIVVLQPGGEHLGVRIVPVELGT